MDACFLWYNLFVSNLWWHSLGLSLHLWWYQPRLFASLYKRKVFSSVQFLSHVRLFVTPWTAAHQASLSITNCQSLPKPMSIESVMPSNHLFLCSPLLLLPSIFPNIRVFSDESTLHIRWPKYWSFSFNIGPSNEHPRLISRGLKLYKNALPRSLSHWCQKTELNYDFYLTSQTVEQGEVFPSLKKRLFASNDGLSFYICGFDYIL